MSIPSTSLNLESLVVSLGRPPVAPGTAINTPVEFSSIYHHGGEIAYSRDSNQTWEALEETIGALEAGKARVFASGMAAISSVIDTLAPRSKIVVPEDSYNGTRHLLSELSNMGRINWVAVDITDTHAVLEHCKDADMLWLESPTNPLLNVCDLRALCSGARELGITSVVDNTFATPMIQRPLELGADLVVHSATKYLSGHSDVLGGVVISRDPSWIERVTLRRSLGGAVLGPMEAFLILRGIRTLALRMEKSQENALILAQRLESESKVSTVRYPGLTSHPGHELASKQMNGFGAIVSFEVLGGKDQKAKDGAERLLAGLKFCTDATSLGGVETLLERRKRWSWEDKTPRGLIRMSVGIEHVEDIWADIHGALQCL